MELVRNLPVNVDALREMVTDPDDLRLLWPLARHPFDVAQWEETLDPARGILSFWAWEKGKPIGHGALDGTNREGVWMARFLFIQIEERGHGAGRKLLSLLEERARDELGADRLELRVRSYNTRALHCYVKNGFSIISSEGTLLMMGKDISPGRPS